MAKSFFIFYEPVCREAHWFLKRIRIRIRYIGRLAEWSKALIGISR